MSIERGAEGRRAFTSPSLELRTDLFPIVLTTDRIGIRDEDLDGYFAAFEREVLDRRQPFVSLVDLLAVTRVPPSSVRKRLAEWSRKIDESAARPAVAIVYVLDSPLVRGTITTINWLFRPSVPIHTEATLARGAARAKELLLETGAPLPVSAREWIASLEARDGRDLGRSS